MTAVQQFANEFSARCRNVGIVYEVNRTMFGLVRIVAHEGGTRSGKTYNTIEWLVDLALSNPEIQITIASRNMPHLKKGAMKDFLKIMGDRRLYNDNDWNASDKIYTFRNKAYIEFFNADDLGKVSGPGRDVLFCNEVNFFKFNIFMQLLRRTTKFCVVDYNPIHPKHWIYDKILIRPDCYLWRSTYKDNRFLPAAQIAEIEMMEKYDPLAWRIYGLGLRGVYQKGQIYGQQRPWKAITSSEYDKIDATEYLGLDWGFYPNPNAVLGVKIVGNKRYIKKYVYARNQSNGALRKYLKLLGKKKSKIIADTSDNKSITEFQKFNWLIYRAVKGPGSVERGIKMLQSKDIYYVMDPDLEFEYYNYVFELGPDEEPTGVPKKEHDHLMDCLRMVEQYKDHL